VNLATELHTVLLPGPIPTHTTGQPVRHGASAAVFSDRRLFLDSTANF